MGLFNLNGIRGWVYGLFATLILSTLWVTSLTILSTPASATSLLTEAGTAALNPFLVSHGLGLSPSTYTALEASAHAAPNRPLSFSVLKVHVLGSEIIGQSYTSTVHLVFSRVAAGYYTGGADAAFNIPAQLKQQLPNFALFNPDNIPLIQGGPTPAQLPSFLQPLFVFTGLTPATFTAAGHLHLASLLPYFWGLTIVLGLLAVALNLSEKKLSGLALALVHSTWPIVAVLLGATILIQVKSTTLGAYSVLLAIIRGAFLPTYGAALAVGLVSLAILKWLESRQQPQPTQQMLPATAGKPPWMKGLEGANMPTMNAPHHRNDGISPNAQTFQSPPGTDAGTPIDIPPDQP